jgi:hypothetical protein
MFLGPVRETSKLQKSFLKLSITYLHNKNSGHLRYQPEWIVRSLLTPDLHPNEPQEHQWAVNSLKWLLCSVENGWI